MHSKSCSTMLVLLLSLAIVFLSEAQNVSASGTIYIEADGSINPPTAPIARIDDSMYVLTDNINDSIVVGRDHIVLDGNGHRLAGTGSENGLDLSGRTNVTVREVKALNFSNAFYMINCVNCTLSGNLAESNTVGFYLWMSSHNVLSENIAINNVFGIYVYETSNYNILRNNNATGNSDRGITVCRASYNIVSQSIATNNAYGIHLFYSSYCTVTNNNASDNGIGIFLEWTSKNNDVFSNQIESNDIGMQFIQISSFNVICHNNFVNNTTQVSSVSSTNIWDNGCEGNYWRNYNGSDTDNDGVGDTFLPWEGVDNFPLMNPYWNPADINHDLKVDLKDVFTTGKAFGSEPETPKWNPHCDINEDGRVDLKDYYAVCKSFGKTYS